MKISFILNEKGTQIDAPSDRRVVDILREDLNLTGTKEGCGAGECGVCTILVDGKNQLSCLMLAAQLEGRSVTTIEGLALDDQPHPVQRAFVEFGAIQCGFCTPGMVLSTVHLLRHHPKPTRVEIKESLSGNLCRCGNYQKIVDAVEAVSKEEGQERIE